jgi:pSer/pThr/pTyr-binding forkhead associated (FHA) protein
MKLMTVKVMRSLNGGRTFPIEQGTNLIGRWDPDSGAFPEIDLEPDDVEAKISRKHAVIERNGDRVTIQDIGSLNGTFVNRGGRLEAGQVVELKSGDELIVGKTFLRFEVLES